MPVITPLSGATKQLSLLNIVRRAMGQLGLTRPTLVYGSTDRTVLQMLDLLQQLGDELVQGETLWQLMIREYVFNLVPTVTDYAFPADMIGMSPATAWDRTTRLSMAGPLTGPEWQFLKSWGVIASPRYQFRIWADGFQIQPAPGSTDTMVFEYISSQWVYSVAATPLVGWIDAFNADTNVTAFPNTLMISGLKKAFLEAKKMPAESETREYYTALELAKSMNAGLPILSIANLVTPYLINENNIPPTGYGT
jgi:hypothetical protein